jgi:hypothetical protein
MPNFLKLLLVCVVFSSCQKKMGGFQKSSSINYNANSSREDNSKPLLESMEENAKVLPIGEELSANTSGDLAFLLKPAHAEIEKNTHPTGIISFPVNRENSDLSVNENSKNEKSEMSLKKRDPVINDSLKIGLVFLIIAVALAFLPALLQLAVLFTLVAMVFLFIGLKKLFNRRAKIKQRNLRKEKNRMRTEKIKDVFKN